MIRFDCIVSLFRIKHLYFDKTFFLSKKPTYDELYQMVEQLLKRVSQLEEEIRRLKHKKNSDNSSIPPSKDENRLRRTSSLRKPTDRKPGGQTGRKGKTLEMVDIPDQIIEILPEYCQCCGESLTEASKIKQAARQVVDIPPVKSIFTEYQTFSKKCKCGHITHSDFPCSVNTPVRYGEHIESIIAYLHTRQYVPFARMQEMLNDIFHINISQGGIHYLLNRFADKLDPVYEIIRQRVQNSKVVGTDETGAKVNGKRNWFWTWQTPKHTFITHSQNRGKETINRHFPSGFSNSTLIHDAWRAQLNTPAKYHQSCLSHLQRNLKYLNELYHKNTWGKSFLKLLYNSLELKGSMIYSDYKENNQKRNDIIKRFDNLLNKPPDKKDKELYTFYKRMLRDRDHIFTFLFIPEVPPDNNASERAIRNIKVKQKISGQFKIEKAAQNFAKIRSVIDTTIKNGMNVMQSLAIIAKLQTG